MSKSPHFFTPAKPTGTAPFPKGDDGSAVASRWQTIRNMVITVLAATRSFGLTADQLLVAARVNQHPLTKTELSGELSYLRGKGWLETFKSQVPSHPLPRWRITVAGAKWAIEQGILEIQPKEKPTAMEGPAKAGQSGQ